MNKIVSTEKIKYFIIALPGLFLLTNIYPYLAVSSILLILLLGIIYLFFKKTITREHYDVLKILVILYVYFIVSYFISNQTVKNFFTFEFLRNDGNFFFCYILFFALSVPFIDYKKAARYYFNVLFFIFPVAALVGIVGYITQNIPFIFKQWGKYYYKGAFTFFNFAHNATGSVFAMVCIFLLVFSLKETKKNLKVLYVILFLICLSGLFITRSRGSYISFFIGAIIVLWLYFRSWKKFFLAFASMLLVSAPLIYFTGTYKRIILIFDPSEPNNSWRLLLWQRAIDMFRQSPIFGIGFGRFNDIIFERSGNALSLKDLTFFSGSPGLISFYVKPEYFFNTSHAHNSYFQFLSETGILGLSLLLLFWIICLKKIYNAYNLSIDEVAKKIFLSAIGAISALFVLAFTENYFSATTVMMCLSMVASLSLGLYWQENKKNNKN
ncbi:MAG: O-antigen ligase family protein [Candidatus Humimicrobiaceae bacterium]